MSSAPAARFADAVGPYADRICVLLNPAAGQDEPERLRRLLGGAFAARGAAIDILATERAGHAAELAARAAALGYRAVCVVGGDGTVAEAATGLAGTAVPLAVVPRGTANQVAQNLGIPLGVEAAVEVAVHGEAIPIDLGMVGERSFALVAGAGFDAAVMASATRELKERWGFGAYVYAAVKEALSATPVPFHLVVDGRAMDVEAVTVMVANVGELFTAWLPLRLPLCPAPAREAWQDGLLDVVVLSPRRPVELARVLWRVTNRHFEGDDRVLHFQAREVTITTEQPVPVQIDGDAAGTTPMTASVRRGALRVLVPPAQAGGTSTLKNSPV
ncbi:MAG: diacylglycerol kinase family protein [Gemmatimonadota bacterium]